MLHAFFYRLFSTSASDMPLGPRQCHKLCSVEGVGTKACSEATDVNTFASVASSSWQTRSMPGWADGRRGHVVPQLLRSDGRGTR